MKRKLTFVLFIMMLCLYSTYAQRQRAPMYYSAYAYLYTENDNNPTTIPMPEDMYRNCIDYIGEHLAPLGFDMICTDGWGEDIRNSDGFRIKHHSSWNNDFAHWSNYAQQRGVKLGLYENPLWVNDQISSTSHLYNPDENAMWFNWLQVDANGAEDYVRRYIEYYNSINVDYLRVDFLSWFEDGKDKSSDLTREHGRPVEHYQRALSWLNKYCDENDIQLSLVMPHLYNHAQNERAYAPGSMIRVNEDACEGRWHRFSDFERGVKHDIWSQYWNAFDGMVYWSDISGFDESQNQMILDGDFIWLSSFANDDEKKSILSLFLMAGSAIALTEYHIEDIQESMHLLRNEEIFALNADGFVGKPLSRDLNNTGSQIWAGQMSTGEWVVGFFNREGSPQERSIGFSQLGLTGDVNVRDLWANQDLGSMNSFSTSVPAHGCVVIKLGGDGNDPGGHQTSMYIGASFKSWSPGDLPMTLENEVWTITDVNIEAGSHELKFVNVPDWSGDDWGDASGLNGFARLTTGGGPNITFNIPTSDSYTITFDDLTLEYNISSGHSGECTSQTITFDAISNKETTDPAFNLNATASSGLSVSYHITGPASLNGNSVTLTGETGTVTVTASQPGNSEYCAANDITHSFNVFSYENNQIISGATYSITSKQSGKALDVSDVSFDNGANIHQWQNYYADNQLWIITNEGNNEYSIKSVHSGKALDVSGVSMDDGANIHQWEYLGNDNQKWYLQRDGDGYFSIISVLSGKALDVDGAAVENGTNIHQWTYYGNDNQLWSFEVINDTNIKTSQIITGFLSQPTNESILIQANGNADYVELYNAFGQKVYSARLYGESKIITTSGFKNGIYIAVFKLKSSIIKTEKILVNNP